MSQSESFPVIVCILGEHRYALPVADIVEVTALVQVTPVPESPREMLGVVNRHGAIIPVLDMRLCFGHEARPLTPATFLVVVRSEDQMAGLVVDDVLEVSGLPAESISKLARTRSYIGGMSVSAQKPLLILDVAELLRAFAPVDMAVEEV